MKFQHFWTDFPYRSKPNPMKAHDMGDTVTAEIVKRRDRGLLDESLNIRGVAFTNGGINFKYAKLRLAQWALRLPFGIGEGINRLFIILGEFTDKYSLENF